MLCNMGATTLGGVHVSMGDKLRQGRVGNMAVQRLNLEMLLKLELST